jgi:hypothetical protein
MRCVMVLMLCQLGGVVMDEIKKDIEYFISVLNAECDVLKKKEQIQPSIVEPWRYYSAPLDDGHEYEHLTSVLEAGRFIVEAEKLVLTGDEDAIWSLLAKAQKALLKSLSSLGKKESKRLGHSRGGQFKTDGIHFKIFCIADDLIEAGGSWRGLAAKVTRILSEQHGILKDENKVRTILKEQKHLLADP